MSEPKYPPRAYRGPWAWLASDLVIGRLTARHQQRAVDALELSPGETVVDAACGTGFNLRRLSAAVGPDGRVLAFEDPCGLYRVAARRARVLVNVDLHPGEALVALEPESVDGAIVSFNPPVVLGRADLLEPLWKALRPGRRLVLVAGRFTRGFGRVQSVGAPLVLTLLGHRRGDARYWRVDEPWHRLGEWGADIDVRPFVGFQYALVVTKRRRRRVSRITHPEMSEIAQVGDVADPRIADRGRVRPEGEVP